MVFWGKERSEQGQKGKTGWVWISLGSGAQGCPWFSGIWLAD